MRLSSNCSPIAASERNADRATSGETRIIQKTAGFPTLKVTTESSRSENQNNKQQAIIITRKHKDSKTKVREKLDKSSKKSTPALRKTATGHRDRTTRESIRKPEDKEKQHATKITSKNITPNGPRTDTPGRDQSHNRTHVNVIICIWWAQLGALYYELLKPSETITGDRYRTQFMRLNQELKEKRPQYQKKHDKVILENDNARPHVARPVKTYLEALKWEVLPHPPYSPDVAPFDSFVSIDGIRPGSSAFPLL